MPYEIHTLFFVVVPAPCVQSGDSVLHCGVLGELRVRVVPLPEAVTLLLFQHSSLLSTLAAVTAQHHQQYANTALSAATNISSPLTSFDSVSTQLSNSLNITEDTASDGVRSTSSEAGSVPPTNDSTDLLLPTTTLPTLPSHGAGLTPESEAALSALRQELDTAFQEAGPEWQGAVDQVGLQHTSMWCRVSVLRVVSIFVDMQRGLRIRDSCISYGIYV